MYRFWILAGLLFASACASTPPQATYVHIVLYKIKSGTPETVMDHVLQDSEALLLPIPTLIGYWVGRPAPKAVSTEYTLDSDYDLGMVFTFKSPRALVEFQGHPNFVEFQKKHGSNLEARVIDFSPYVAGPEPTAPTTP